MIAFQVERPQARVFVLIGPNTLSAAQNFISTLDQWMKVTFAGEPSGSRPNHTGDDTLVVLPYSGLMGSIACALHQTTFRDSRPWISPALPVSLSSQDYFAQRDPVLEAVLHEIGEPLLPSPLSSVRGGAPERRPLIPSAAMSDRPVGPPCVQERYAPVAVRASRSCHRP
jgi:hypothetical protein